MKYETDESSALLLLKSISTDTFTVLKQYILKIKEH
jgi:hypothetical protein